MKQLTVIFILWWAWVLSVNCTEAVKPELVYVSPDQTPRGKVVEAYVNRFLKVAKAEQAKYGIPASFKLAQAIKESASGQSRLAKTGNNHFGIKAFKHDLPEHIIELRAGKTKFHDTDDKVRFIKYRTAWDSWRYHSEFLVRYYGKPGGSRDWKAWNKKIAPRYATDGSYKMGIASVINKYELHKLD